jgi:flavodoxin
MKNVLVVYNSKTGTTEKFANEIAKSIEKDAQVTTRSIGSCKAEDIASADKILFGCWTSGLFFFGQHPEKVWAEFASQLPTLDGKEVALFTTYKLATGSMFKKMSKKLPRSKNKISLKLKSKNGELKVSDAQLLNSFVMN